MSNNFVIKINGIEDASPNKHDITVQRLEKEAKRNQLNGVAIRYKIRDLEKINLEWTKLTRTQYEQLRRSGIHNPFFKLTFFSELTGTIRTANFYRGDITYTNAHGDNSNRWYETVKVNLIEQ